MIMAKDSNNNYVNIEDIEAKNNNEYQDIEKIVSKQGNLLYNKYKETEDTLPINFKGKGKDLKNYRIYGNTVDGESVGDRTANLFDMKKFAETAYPQNATVNYSENSLIFTATQVDAYVNQVYAQINIPVALRSSCINVQPLTTYTISMNAPYKCFISWINDSFDPVARYTQIPNNQTSYTFTTPEDCTKLLLRLGKDVTNIGDTFTISNIMLNTGSTALPYEPYGYKVPVTVKGKNLAKNNHSDSSALLTVEEVNNFIHVSGTNNSGSTIAVVISAGNSFPVGKYDIVNNSNTAIMYDYKNENNVLVSANVNANSIKTFNFPAVFTRKLNVFKSVSNGNSIDNYFQVMIVKHGDDTDTYEPYHAPVTTPIYLPEQIRKVGDEAEYIDYAQQKQHRVRKNLLKNTMTIQTIKGVTFTGNSDGSITCNGTASDNILVNIIPSTFSLPEGAYILNGAPPGGGQSYNFKLDVRVSSGSTIKYYPDTGNGIQFKILQTERITMCRIAIYLGYTCDNLTFYPMIRKADIEDDTYEPYIENTDLDVTLPALPTFTGTNVLSVGTAVQPSKVYLKGKLKRTIYGWHVDPDISDSSNAVTYLKDAIGMTPASMGSTTFNYGSWQNAFFMPKPCMLKSNGKVDYYLDPNDYTKKLNGAASDIANPNYDGNAMMQWPKIWFKYVKGIKEGQGYFYVANYKADGNFHCWCNYDSENNEIDHFYTAIYNGTGTTKLRSISGVALTSANGNGGTNVTEEVTRATANNTTSAVEWYTEVFSDKLLINALLVLMGKSLNTQVVFGRGLDFGGRTAKEAYITGTLNDKGLFWGVTANGKSAVKVFGMENWWGCVWHRVAGCISVNNTLRVKLTYNTADGSTTNGYNQTGSSYIDNGDIPTSSGYLKTMRYNKLGYSPSSVIGSSSESYYGDYFYQNAGTDYLLLGGYSGGGVAAGPFCFGLDSAPGIRYWSLAAALSCKPLLN